MQWTKDAKEAIRAVPAGFQRRRAKAKIEKSARKLGMTTITLEYAAPMIKEAASEDYQPIFANKGAGTSVEAQANWRGAQENGTQVPQDSGNGHAEPRLSLYAGRRRPKPGLNGRQKALCVTARRPSS